MSDGSASCSHDPTVVRLVSGRMPWISWIWEPVLHRDATSPGSAKSSIGRQSSHQESLPSLSCRRHDQDTERSNSNPPSLNRCGATRSSSSLWRSPRPRSPTSYSASQSAVYQASGEVLISDPRGSAAITDPFTAYIDRGRYVRNEAEVIQVSTVAEGASEILGGDPSADEIQSVVTANGRVRVRRAHDRSDPADRPGCDRRRQRRRCQL